MNLSIRTFLYIIGTLFFFLLASIVFTSYSLKETTDKLIKIEKDKSLMNTYSDLLRQSSDDLTKYARLYVVTANEEYKDIYYNILDIRNGDKRRPNGYEYIYWDIFEPARSQRHPLGKKKAFNDILKELPFDAYEYKKLKESENNSNELVALEIEAFNAMVGLYKDENNHYSLYKDKNQKKAIELLHSVEYLKAKEKIMLPIDDFLVYLEKRSLNDINTLEKSTIFYVNILFYLSIGFITLFIVIVYLIKNKILDPILFLTKLIENFKNKKVNISKKKIFYHDEIGSMTEKFYEMKENINKDIKILEKNDREIKEYVSLVDKNIITSSTDLSGKITYVSEAFEQVSGYKKDELIGKTHSVLKHPDMPEDIYKELWDTVKNNQVWHGDIKNRKKDGDYYWVHATIYPIYDEENKKVGYTAIRVNITDNKKVQELLKESRENQEKIEDYVTLIDENIITSSTDLSGVITEVSEAFCNVSGYNKNELIGKKHSIVRAADVGESIYSELWDTILNNRKWIGEIKNRKKDGSYYWVNAVIYPIFGNNSEKIGYTAIAMDITDHKKVEELLITDALTGIYNRRHFNQYLPKAINHAKRDGKYISLAIIDIDHFKQYNDTYGHQDGDEALISVSKAIKDTINRASDACFRLGGEEFGIIIESLKPKEAYDFVDLVRSNVEKLKIKHEKSSVSKYVTISVGLVTKIATQNIVVDEIYKEADDYLYKAKENGRNMIMANSYE